MTYSGRFLLSLVAATALAGCAEESIDPAPQDRTSATTSPASGQDVSPAQAVVDEFYTALGRRDCFTMRTLSALSYQQDDVYWADGCIDELQAIVGETYAYKVVGGLVDGQEADFRVERELPDGSSVVDEVALIAVSGWQVESRTPVGG